ncbi:CotS family spore coat protein [Clostridium sp.]|uniref:CotS family spore coat protein n=1 Tax=Clostridium sp. TaxID=1506 RepID=UPI002FC5A95C
MEKVIKVLEENYNIKVEEISQIKNVYRIKSSNKILCFKVSRYKEYIMDFIIDSIEHVESNGFNGVLSPILSNGGKKYIPFESGYGYLCRWVPSREADYKNPIDLKLCVNALAKFHRASFGFDKSRAAIGRRYHGKWINKFSKKVNQMYEFKRIAECRLEKSDFDKVYVEEFNKHIKRANSSIESLKKSSYREVLDRHYAMSGICHHDTANHNFLIDDNLDVYLIDFDYCIQDTHLHDLSSIIIRNLKCGNWNMDTLNYIVSNYTNEIEVTPDEFNIMGGFIEFPQDYWQVGLQYYVEQQPWEEEFFNKRLSRCKDDFKDKYDFLDNGYIQLVSK